MLADPPDYEFEIKHASHAEAVSMLHKHYAGFKAGKLDGGIFPHEAARLLWMTNAVSNPLNLL